jgi:uncharacterized membrane protein
MPSKQQAHRNRKQADKTAKRRKHQKQVRLNNLLLKIRGVCSVCGKMQVKIGKKEYQCPDHHKHQEEKQSAEEIEK